MRLHIPPALILLLVLAAGASAQTYYADISIALDQTGYAEVSGSTNHHLLETSGTSQWTSKKGDYWLFNLTLPKEDKFSDYIYEVTLPPGSAINYVKTSAGAEFRISSSGDRVKVTGIGEDKDFSVIIQYSLGSLEKDPDYGYLLPGIAAFVIVLTAYVYLRGKKKKPKRREIKGPVTQHETTDVLDAYSLSDRQKEIYGLLKEAEKPVNQAYICEKLDLPKSSVSRNIDSLERKGLVTKIRDGMSTLISLKEK